MMNLEMIYPEWHEDHSELEGSGAFLQYDIGCMLDFEFRKGSVMLGHIRKPRGNMSSHNLPLFGLTEFR